jgi:hypothetical protein
MLQRLGVDNARLSPDLAIAILGSMITSPASGSSVLITPT